MDISIVLPVRNEEQLIHKCLLDISNHLRKSYQKYEILVIINGCNDSTLDIVKKATLKNKQIKILHSKPGYGAALKKGMQSALGKYVVIFNVDFYNINLIDLSKIDLFGRDLIIGSKMTYWSADQRPLSRKIVSYLYNKLLRLIFGFKGSDTHGIKIIKKVVIDNVLKKCRIKSGVMDTEFVIKAQRSGYKIADFPVNVKEIRPPRFINRLSSTPFDLYELFNSLK